MSISSMIAAQRRLLSLGLAILALFSACSGDDREFASVGLPGGTPRVAGTACAEGQVQPCSITLSKRAGTLECYHGTQLCLDGRWSECQNGKLSEQAALAAPLGLRSQALNEPTGCQNNPCNPYCRWFDEVPETPLDAVDGEGGNFDWDAGSLAGLPGSVIETALNQPCSTARDCQFNTRCENPNSGSCSHSVCASGVPLSENCSECAELAYEIAEQSPTAYGQCFALPADASAEQCVHDPCSTGLALKSNCDEAVARLCLEPGYATCCTESWDRECVERFRSQNPGVCQCGTGEVARGDACLYHNTASLNWSAARDTCRARGDGWDLAWVLHANENSYLSDTWGSSTGGAGLWIGFNDLITEGSWSYDNAAVAGSWDEATRSATPGLFVNWESAEPATGTEASCAAIGTSGAWQGHHCGNDLLPSVCKGPPLHSTARAPTECATSGEYFEYWAFYENYTGALDHTFSPGEQYVITIVARGDYAGGAWPEMEVAVDFAPIGTAVIDASGWKSYTFEYTAVTAAPVPVMVTFLNDYSDASSDRNFYVNSISIQCAGAGPVTPTWSNECIGLAEATCGIRCNPEQEAVGVCVPWLPGETDDSCPDRPDLALGVPCEGSIVVCNHGGAAVEEEVTVVHFPEGAAQFGSAAPDMTVDDVVTCTTDERIAPGECISLSESECRTVEGEPAPLTGTRHLMVNPPGPAAVTECSGLDNWAIHVDGISCGAPACFGGSTGVTRVRRPVDIVFVIDNSASMAEEIAQVEQRINEDFAAIIEASGLDYRVIMVSRYGDLAYPFGGIGGVSWPICVGAPLGGTDCSDPNNQVPTPGERFFHYSANVGSNDALCLLLDGFSAPDELGVQNRPGWQVLAPEGYGAWLRPDAFKTFVVITDDNVQCGTAGNLWLDDRETATGGERVAADFDAALRTLSPAQFSGPGGERKYIWHSIVNVRENVPAAEPWSSDADIVTDLCTGPPGSYVGPGTGYQALSRMTGGLRYPSCRTSDFNAVFNAIAEQVIDTSAASCMFELNGSNIDLTEARVSYQSGQDERTDLSEVSDEGNCTDNGWYLELPASTEEPPVLSLCPEACSMIQADPGAHVFVEFGCEMSASPTTHNELYEAECPQGSIVEWKALGYDTTITGDGFVEFSVRTGATLEELGDASYTHLNTATESAPQCLYLDKMTCVPEDVDCHCVPTDSDPPGVGGGVELSGNKLDPVAAQQPYLELLINMVPSSEGSSPTVQDWRVAYSCLPGE